MSFQSFFACINKYFVVSFQMQTPISIIGIGESSCWDHNRRWGKGRRIGILKAYPIDCEHLLELAQKSETSGRERGKEGGQTRGPVGGREGGGEKDT
jgi:hypothetical protein